MKVCPYVGCLDTSAVSTQAPDLYCQIWSVECFDTALQTCKCCTTAAMPEYQRQGFGQGHTILWLGAFPAQLATSRWSGTRAPVHCPIPTRRHLQVTPNFFDPLHILQRVYYTKRPDTKCFVKRCGESLRLWVQGKQTWISIVSLLRHVNIAVRFDWTWDM